MIVGVDPGLKGSFFAIRDNGGLIADVMPVVASAIDPGGIVRILTRYTKMGENVFCVCEKPQSMPQNKASAMLNYGQGFGYIVGALASLGIPYSLVPPKVWQKVMHEGVDCDLDPKQKSLVAALRLFPSFDFKLSGQFKKDHDGVVDAALIALYGKRVLV
jgi:hypothetical protein